MVSESYDTPVERLLAVEDAAGGRDPASSAAHAAAPAGSGDPSEALLAEFIESNALRTQVFLDWA